MAEQNIFSVVKYLWTENYLYICEEFEIAIMRMRYEFS